MTRRIVKYTNEYKLEAVNLALRSPSISGIAKDLGIPISTLHTWIKALASKTKSSKTNTDEAKDITAIIEENRRLHKVNTILKEEKDILKKAAAYFAQNQK